MIVRTKASEKREINLCFNIRKNQRLCGYSDNDMAKMLGVSLSSYQRKLRDCCFKYSELSLIVDKLKFTNEQKLESF